LHPGDEEDSSISEIDSSAKSSNDLAEIPEDE
jgi:hypothetical protein